MTLRSLPFRVNFYVKQLKSKAKEQAVKSQREKSDV